MQNYNKPQITIIKMEKYDIITSSSTIHPDNQGDETGGSGIEWA